ncbi:MAG: hypothetical protein OQK12_06575 [Motiliproteus sp.]|nr:hypothetical protein [Motiliproteus sp.]MCW9051956.1 hypothetical protein [Motiliproteus sp.]
MQQRRFIELWQRNVSSSEADASKVFEQLQQLYGQSHRHYHNASHIDFCLKWFDHYKHVVTDADAVELAIWFHDACYGLNPKGHEDASAQLFQQLSADALDPQRQQKICRLISATIHRTPAKDEEEALLIDIDLASFARPWPQYLRDTALCRAERSQLEEKEFCHCQVEFLQSLLARQTLYYSAPFRQHHESTARSNIERLIGLLETRADRCD